MGRSRKKQRRQAWNRFADAGRGLLVGTASVLPECQDADRVRVTAGECFVAIKLITHLLKKAVPEPRPDGANDDSFPSEHTAVCVAAATVIEREYPREIGVLAWALAAAVALARIEGKRHYPRDVIAGAVIGGASVWVALKLRSGVAQRLVGSC